ncbi:NAD-dependent succinate-semialdehyde dehydrogenase [Geodermatophilus sp. DF01-2]|uniref:NAD-dependent succinate-semialdehyde dehydrogenase n=1 Tax=Geodermatophilus sp. DF01-2 TaxID=2559610 RepID=UPI001073A2A8|nr:NAD-dependent succinate-semialdehyde dehydrogenase [Geodermatophilus sp. DF01_2]TFV54292.1 NAD-dependent succinate-semialdehyde dehydrogenase [Geodermatophilus sp. DF01_2]
MKLVTDLFINGTWHPGSGRVAVHDPATAEVIAEVATASEAECDAAIAAAHAALPSWAARPARERAEILRRAFELLTAEADEFAELITRENGKVLADARSEVIYAAEFFRWFSEEAVRVAGDYRAAPGGDKRMVVTHEPVGVSLLITPWNFPAAMATRKIGPALAAGCTVVLKPATETPLTALAMAELLQRAGVPDGVVNVILPVPVGRQVDRMLHDPRVRNLSFTGSTEVGRVLLRSCADTIVRASMELGGNAPFLVLEGADVEAAVAGAMVAKMRNGGSACTAANRFYVHHSLAEEFARRLAEEMGGLRLAPGLEEGAQLGALVSPGERDKVAGLVDSAVAAGARCVVGGAVPDGGGAFYPATVLAEVAPDADLLRTEIFGPVAPIVVFDDEGEAIRLANDTEYGLIAYVFAADEGRGMRAAHRLQAGMVAVNRGVVSDPAAPFGGMKQSGLGREGGFAGIHEFLETKYIATDL